MLELFDQHHLGVVQRCLRYLYHRLLLLNTLIVFLTRLQDDLILLPYVPTMVDNLNGAIEVDMAAEL